MSELNRMPKERQSMSGLKKISLLGDIQTGKTTFIQSLNRNFASTPYSATRTVQSQTYESKAIIYDTPGDATLYYTAKSKALNSNSVIIFVDSANERTFQRARTLIKELGVFNQICLHLYDRRSPEEIAKQKINIGRLEELYNVLYLESGGKKFSGGQTAKDIIDEVLRHQKIPKIERQVKMITEQEKNTSRCCSGCCTLI